MCGLVCLWNSIDSDLARRMIEKIGHRGPDATEITPYPQGPAVFAHCRLSIIGLENGRQPLLSGHHALVANGEIYNHRELRAALGENRFETASDCEVILRLFETREPRWIDRLEGMFAFVIATPDRVVAGRDPLGIKPLFMARMGETLAFASELKAFDGLALDELTSIHPGHLFDSRDGIRQWFRMPHGSAVPETDADAEQIAEELRRVLETAVRKWMVADVEVGSLLSGGLDSSLMAAIAAQVAAAEGRRLKTFAVGTAGSPDIAAARAVARHIGSDHFELIFDDTDIVEALPHVIYHLESADIDTVRSALPTHFATTLARRHVKAVLTGEGADELFAGYTYQHAYASNPRSLADELTRALGTMHNINLQRVDRITMGQGLEARTPLLDRDLIAFAQSIPASLKMRLNADGSTTEKWILRKAVEDLLPYDLVWRKKAQFDEGSGTVTVIERAVAALTGEPAPIGRDCEGRLYEARLRERYIDPDRILVLAGRWTSDRLVAVA